MPHPVLAQQPPPASDSDLVEIATGSGTRSNVRQFDLEFDEGLKVGYKWYDAQNKQPLFPFGFGLSYTDYKYSGLEVTAGAAPTVQFVVRNGGARAGAEIAQVYATLPGAAGEPFKRLVAWQKVQLAPGESKTVELKLDPKYLSIFNAGANRWELVPGNYAIAVGGSSQDLPLGGALLIGAGR